MTSEIFTAFVHVITGSSPTVIVPLGTLVRVTVPLTAKAVEVVVARGCPASASLS